MKAIISVMFVMIMAFALVSNVEAGTCSGNLDNHGASLGLTTPLLLTPTMSMPAIFLRLPKAYRRHR